MNRQNQEHFATTPTINIGRSKFDRSFTHKTSLNSADLIPFFVDPQIVPGDTVKMNMSEVVRMTTPIAPVMDNLKLDVMFFFVPNRLIWDHWQEFMGENKTEPWAQTVEYEIPQIVAPEGGWTEHSLACHMGYPIGVGGYKASALPFRAYAMIWNEFFRDENLKNPCYISMGDSDTTGKDITGANIDYVTDVEKGAVCAKVAKTFDYFTSCLPEAQKGPAIKIPLGDGAPVNFAPTEEPYNSNYASTDYEGRARIAATGVSNSFPYKEANTYLFPGGGSYELVADLSEAAGATVNQLRQCFAIQKFYERAAIGGTRYIETIKAHFGVTNPDFRLQRPEYLGGFSQPVQMNQVIQSTDTREYSVYDDEASTWVTKESTPQGNAAAYSLTAGKNPDLFTHSFTEHGILMGVMCVRVASRSYQQGLSRLFSAKKFTDFYWPEFAHLGNQAVLEKEIYIQGTDDDEDVFGYQEAYAHMRYFPDIITGELNSGATTPLDIWHYGDYYESAPTLGSDWIDEDKSNVERTLAVQDHDQFIADILCHAIYTRPMPLYSVPGLIDHF